MRAMKFQLGTIVVGRTATRKWAQVVPPERPLMARAFRILNGQSMSALPLVSDVKLLSDVESIIHLNTKIPYRALDLGVSEQQLDGAQIACPTINQCGLRSPQ